MSARVFFKIGTVDFTAFTNIQDFSINEVEVADTWEDANRRIHKYIFRTRKQGEVTLEFQKAADYNAFLAAMISQRATTGTDANTYQVTSWVANSGSMTAEVQYTAYIETMGSAKWDLQNGHQLITQVLTVTEA